MKKYRVTTSCLADIDYGDILKEVENENFQTVYEHESTARFHPGIVEHNPEWFQPVEEEVKEGQYRYCKTNKKPYRINKKDSDGRYEILWLYPYVEPDNIERYVSKVSIEGDKLLDDDSVSEALIAEAKRRGFEDGVTYNDRGDIGKITAPFKFKYHPLIDALIQDSHTNDIIYEQGNWAEIVDEPIQINEHEITVEKEQVNIDCGDTINRDIYEAFYAIVIKYDLEVERHGENINNQIEEIWRQF